MGSLFVVVGGPFPDRGAGMGHVAEHGLVQKLVAHAAVETLDKAVLHWLAGSDVVPLDVALGGKG